MKDFGDWIYKMQTLPAKELVALSEAGFTRGVLKHVKTLYPDSVKLARIHQIPDGRIEKLNTEFMGVVQHIESRWGFAAVFCQTDKDEILSMPLGNVDEKILDQPNGPRLSLMDIIRNLNYTNWVNSQFHPLVINLEGSKWGWQGKTIKRLMICVEYRREITKVDNRFFAYDEEFPTMNRRGICVVSKLNFGGKPATLEFVAIPTQNDVLLFGQMTAPKRHD
jgi:hypothetical protein